MPLTDHTEAHFTATEVVRDLVIGMSDGLTVPFALAAGLSGAAATSSVVVTAGLAEIVAGSIAMGLGGYLAARSEVEHYISEHAREVKEVAEQPEAEKAEVAELLEEFGLTLEEGTRVAEALSRRPDAWVKFMMRFELGLEEPKSWRAAASAATIAGAYIGGGLIPLAPYVAVPNVNEALKISAAVTLLALLVFGYIKGRYTGANPIRSAIQAAAIGGLASIAAFTIAKMIA